MCGSYVKEKFHEISEPYKRPSFRLKIFVIVFTE